MYFRTYLYKNILEKYKKEFKQVDTSDIIIKSIEIPACSKDLLLQMVEKIIPMSISICFIIGYLLYTSRKLGIVALVAVIFVILSIIYQQGDCSTKFIKSYEYYKKVNEVLNDKLQNMLSIYTSSTINKEIDNNENVEYLYKTKDTISMLCVANMKALIIFISIMTYAILLFQNYTEFRQGKYLSGIFIANMMIITDFLGFIESIANEIPMISYNCSVLKNEMKYIQFISDNTPSHEIVDNQIIKSGHISFKNIVFGYSDKKKIFDNFNLEIQPNTTLAVIGKSGSGKSTLIKLLLGFYNIESGVIKIDGHNIDDLDVNVLRSSISYVNQNTTLFKDTTIANIKYGTTATNKDVEDAISQYELWDIFNSLENKLQTNVGVLGNNLSGGQKQIIIILRALLNKNSHILLMDEPTSAVDIDHKKIIMNLIKKIKTKTIILITHDENIMNDVDKVIYIGQ
jgi:ABC-type multidrug transport system fused ATPase/permease subunit